VRIFWSHRLHPNVQLRRILFNQNLSNIPHPNVLRSFFGADLSPDEAFPEGNPERIGKGKNEIWAQIRPNKTELVRVM
ncbi:MAG: hypothetical protein J6L88_05725, partial [Clostridia bacterium]|nr:hypothetical protein [Clostridia bacterium]